MWSYNQIFEAVVICVQLVSASFPTEDITAKPPTSARSFAAGAGRGLDPTILSQQLNASHEIISFFHIFLSFSTKLLTNTEYGIYIYIFFSFSQVDTQQDSLKRHWPSWNSYSPTSKRTNIELFAVTSWCFHVQHLTAKVEWDLTRKAGENSLTKKTPLIKAPVTFTSKIKRNESKQLNIFSFQQDRLAANPKTKT